MKDNKKKWINKIKRFEKFFAFHNYSGKGKDVLNEIKGTSKIAACALQSVNYLDTKKRTACPFTGGLVKLLAYETGCHAFCAEKVYNVCQKELLTAQLEESIRKNDIKVLIDFHTVDENCGYVAKLWKDEKGRHSKVVKRLIQFAFEYEYRDKLPEKEVIKYEKNKQETMALNAAHKAEITYVHIELNEKYFNSQNQDEFLYIIDTLIKIFTILSNVDWQAENIGAYRLWQSASHKPQDKIEMSNAGEQDCTFELNSLLNICSYGNGEERVRLHKPGGNAQIDLRKDFEGEEALKSEKEYVFLTNRLIRILFGRRWIENEENTAGLKGAPVIVYESQKEEYSIGFPKVDKIDGVFFSTELFRRKKEEAEHFDYVLFNRYTDSRLPIEFDKADYGDGGGVRSKDGPAERVMLPRYYKRLLGYMDYPVLMIRSEEYYKTLGKLTQKEKNCFEACYEAISGETFHRLKMEKSSSESDADRKKQLEQVADIQKNLGFYGKVELLKIPKKVSGRKRIYKRILSKFRELKMVLLEKAIGKSEYLLRTQWTSETDDKNNIARLNPDMMMLLGAMENDKIIINFGKKQEVLRVLASEQLTDYQIGIPALTRRKLGMNSINDIVVVYRDMGHIFRRHSEEQAIAILGTIFTVFQVITKMWIGVLFCVICIPMIMFFVLNKERVKVK
ncbi:hypothetical protein D3Z60_03115 [Lachnospiraceae bacterium]|nr:hypothetical protein [Lachnospiraceae bacterium]